MPRKKSDTVQLKIRMKEPMRAKIEKAAKARRVSMNEEMVARLNATMVGEEHYGGPEMAACDPHALALAKRSPSARSAAVPRAPCVTPS